MENLIAFMASPRNEGNTEVMLSAFLDGVNEKRKDIKINLIKTSFVKINHCKECDYCFTEGTCIQRDEMENIVSLLTESKYIVVASPIFFYHFPSTLKVIIDRCQVLWARKYKLKIPISQKYGYYIGVGATKGENLFECTKITLKYFFDVLNCKLMGEFLVRRIDEKGIIKKYTNILLDLREEGKKFVS